MEFAASYMYKQLENRRYKYIGETIYLWDYDAMCKICRSLSFCYFLLYYWRLISTPEIPNLYPLCFTIVSWYCPSNSNARGKEERKDDLQSKNNDPWQVGMHTQINLLYTLKSTVLLCQSVVALSLTRVTDRETTWMTANNWIQI